MFGLDILRPWNSLKEANIIPSTFHLRFKGNSWYYAVEDLNAYKCSLGATLAVECNASFCETIPPSIYRRINTLSSTFVPQNKSNRIKMEQAKNERYSDTQMKKHEMRLMWCIANGAFYHAYWTKCFMPFEREKSTLIQRTSEIQMWQTMSKNLEFYASIRKLSIRMPQS